MTANEALLAEGIPERRIMVTGNTVIDAVMKVVAQVHDFTEAALRRIVFDSSFKSLLVTAHMRESLGASQESICYALRDLLTNRQDLHLVFPVRLNPKVRKTVWSILGDVERAYLADPLDSINSVHLINCVDLI